MKRNYVILAVVAVAVVGLGVAFPDYLRLLRPNVLKQLDPELVGLVNELPAVDAQNKEIVGRLFAHGGLEHAKEGADGVMRIDVRVPPGELIWKPAIIVIRIPASLRSICSTTTRGSTTRRSCPATATSSF